MTGFLFKRHTSTRLGTWGHADHRRFGMAGQDPVTPTVPLKTTEVKLPRVTLANHPTWSLGIS